VEPNRIDEELTVLFSGRFDPPHCGHISNILSLGMRYRRVLVVVLNHPEQDFPITYRIEVLKDILSKSKGEYEVSENYIHFSDITIEEFQKYGADVYAAGNMAVIKHMESLGVPCVWVNRAYEYEATNERLAKKIKELVK